MPRRKRPSGKAAMKRFEEFSRRIFAVSKDDLKDDLKKAEEEVEEIVEDIAEPTERPTADE